MTDDPRENGNEFEEEQMPSGNTRKMLYWIVPIAVLLIVVIIFGGNLFKNEDARYNQLIKEADVAFNTGKYQQAREHYREASEIKPSIKYPRERLLEIDSLMQEKDRDKMYQNAIQEAESLLASLENLEGEKLREKYQEVLRYFIKASKIKPDKQYPREKITRIEDYLEGRIEEKPVAGIEPEEKVKEVAKERVTGSAAEEKRDKPEAEKKKTTPPPPEKTAGEATGRFHIIVGAFQNKDNAVRYSRKMEQEGFDSRLIPIKGGTLNAVTCGSFKTMQEASRALEKVQREIKENAWILEH